MSGYRLRPATSDDLPALAATNIACWRETYAAQLPAEFLRSLEDNPHYDLTCWQALFRRWRAILVEPDGARAAATPEVAGFVLFGQGNGALPPFDAQIEKLYLRKSVQGFGLGRNLMRAAAQDLLREGRRSLIVWMIDPNKPAERFYRKLGGVRVGEPQTFMIGQLTLHEIAFAWPRLADLAENG